MGFDEMDALQFAENTRNIDTLRTIIGNMQDDIMKLQERIKALEYMMSIAIKRSKK